MALAENYKMARIYRIMEENADTVSADLKALFDKYIAAKGDKDAERALQPQIKELAAKEANADVQSLAKEDLVEKSVWIIGGDGWSYDIGYGGVDHVLANDVNVNILVLDTEVYSNTGGQSSKSSQPLSSLLVVNLLLRRI